MINSATNLLQNFFLNPIGLLALLGVIPVIIFYLTRPEPDRKVMPSMEFFSENEKDSMLQSAIKKLKSNLILLINIFMIVLMASAIASMYLQGSGQDQSVVIYDRSASMIEEHASMVSTVQSSSASDVTLIEVTDTVEVHEGLNRQEAVEFVRDNPPSYFDGDLGAALQEARQYDGDIVLLSNLDSSASLVNEYRNLGAERGLSQVSYSTENQLGFVDTGKDYVEIRNYGHNDVTTRLTINEESEEIELDARSNTRIGLNLSSGENRLELPRDGFTPDNEAFIYIPGDESLGVEYHGPENDYLTTALELIEGVEIVEEDGEVVILNEENEELYNGDGPKVLMQGSSSHWGVESSEKTVEFTVVNSRIESDVYKLNASENSFTQPKEALFVEEDNVYYNFEDSKLRQSIVYPVLWKKMIGEIAEPQNFENSNLKIQFTDREEPGIYNGEAVNFLDQEQSETNYNNIQQDIEASGTEISQASVLALLAVLLLGGETLLLLQKGVYQ